MTQASILPGITSLILFITSPSLDWVSFYIQSLDNCPKICTLKNLKRDAIKDEKENIPRKNQTPQRQKKKRKKKRVVKIWESPVTIFPTHSPSKIFGNLWHVLSSSTCRVDSGWRTDERNRERNRERTKVQTNWRTQAVTIGRKSKEPNWVIFFLYTAIFLNGNHTNVQYWVEISDVICQNWTWTSSFFLIYAGQHIRLGYKPHSFLDIVYRELIHSFDSTSIHYFSLQVQTSSFIAI